MCTCHHTRLGETKQNASTSLGSALRVKNVSWRTECRLVRWMLEEICAQGERVNTPEGCIGSDSWSVSGAGLGGVGGGRCRAWKPGTEPEGPGVPAGV